MDVVWEGGAVEQRMFPLLAVYEEKGNEGGSRGVMEERIEWLLLSL